MNQNYINEILAIIRSNKGNDYIKEELLNYHENDIAKIFPLLSKDERLKLYKILDQDTISDIFSYLDEPTEYLDEMSNDAAADILEKMDTDDAIDILEEMEESDRKELIDLMDKEAADDIKLISSYSDDMIGSKMTTNYIAISRYATVKKAMKTMVNEAATNDNVSILYFVDDDDTFYGAMDLRDLIIARDGSNLDDLIKTSYPYLKATELVSDCLGKIKDYALDSIPVVDDNDHLIGVITSDDIVEAVRDEMGDDYAKLGGLSEEEDLHEPLFASLKKRMPWLLILLVLGMAVSGVVGAFEKVVSQLTIIMAFQSLILDMAGNVGTQSLAVTIRVKMDKDLTAGKKLKLVAKEMRVGLSCGLILGVLSVLFVGLYIMLFKGYPVWFSFAVSACIGSALMLAMLISSGVGTLVPMFFKKIGVDPAVASGPLITTVNDLVAVVTYYGLSWLLLLQVLHLGG